MIDLSEILSLKNGLDNSRHRDRSQKMYNISCIGNFYKFNLRQKVMTR